MPDEQEKPWFDFFKIHPKRADIRGSSDHYLSLPSVGPVYMYYCQQSIKWYGRDPRKYPVMMDRKMLSQVHAFTKRNTIEGSLFILGRLFSPAREGRWNGDIVGPLIFSSGYSWMARRLLSEGGQDV